MNGFRHANLFSSEWRLIAAIFGATNSGGKVDDRRLMDLMRAHEHSRGKDVSPESRKRSLLDTGILEEDPLLPGHYRLWRPVEDHVAAVLGLERMFLAEYILEATKKIESFSSRLVDAVRDEDRTQFHVVRNGLLNLSYEIVSYLRTNLSAVQGVVARAKQQSHRIPLKQRYQEVIEVWEQYLVPMGSMLERSGPFSAALSACENNIRAAIRLVNHRPSMVSDERNLQELLYAINEVIRATAVQKYADAADALNPLYERARFNMKVSQGAAYFLDCLGKDGLGAKGRPWRLAQRIRIHLPVRSSRPLPPDSVLIGALRNIRKAETPPPPIITPPDSQRLDESRTLAARPTEEVMSKMARSLPIPDLMSWLDEHFPSMAATDRLYFIYEAHTRPDWKISWAGSVSYVIPPYRIHMKRVSVERSRLKEDTSHA